MINAYHTSGTSPTKRKRKIVKVVVVNAHFPELSNGAMHQTGKGRGSSLRVAFAAAGRDLFRQPKLKCKRFTQFAVSVTVGTEAAA
jgi:hypothetical protein